MPSFSAIFLLATTAFAALSSAAPILNLGDANTIGNIAAAPVAGINSKITLVDKREDVLHTLPIIFTTVETRLASVSEKLNAIDAVTGTEVEAVTPIINEVKEILTVAIAEVHALVGHPIEFILSVEGRVLSIPEVAYLLSSVSTLVLGVIALVFKTVSVAGAHVVLPLLVEVAHLLVALITAVTGIVEGLLVILAPILGPVIALLYNLGLGDVVAVINAIL
ncbi:hypothetical protein Hypma_013928 [Hypsizygus marmoreus]|uniref:Uncharacterized protein n=1 Tax=Hypsizygus marmoreus TaxID=39966 RepID=A0A369K828_HYPMA|nr:hypothetical protein Hypma_013928 [Hypsizygus marmoreus]